MKYTQNRSNGMTRHMLMLPVFLVAAVALIMGAASRDCWAGIESFEDVKIIFEVNATDGDAGAQVFLDGEGWKCVRIYDPEWRQILKVGATGGVKHIGGGTELFLETVEPEYESLDELQEILDQFPKGKYKFFGWTGEGWLVGKAELTYNIPAGPVILGPLPGPGEDCAEGVPLDDAEISWEAVTKSITDEPITIIGYQIIVEGEDIEFSAKLPADATSVTVPPEILEPGTEYGFEVLAIEDSGNQTITEGCFMTEE